MKMISNGVTMDAKVYREYLKQLQQHYQRHGITIPVNFDVDDEHLPEQVLVFEQFIYFNDAMRKISGKFVPSIVGVDNNVFSVFKREVEKAYEEEWEEKKAELVKQPQNAGVKKVPSKVLSQRDIEDFTDALGISNIKYINATLDGVNKLFDDEADEEVEIPSDSQYNNTQDDDGWSISTPVWVSSDAWSDEEEDGEWVDDDEAEAEEEVEETQNKDEDDDAWSDDEEDEGEWVDDDEEDGELEDEGEDDDAWSDDEDDDEPTSSGYPEGAIARLSQDDDDDDWLNNLEDETEDEDSFFQDDDDDYEDEDEEESTLTGAIKDLRSIASTYSSTTKSTQGTSPLVYSGKIGETGSEITEDDAEDEDALFEDEDEGLEDEDEDALFEDEDEGLEDDDEDALFENEDDDEGLEDDDEDSVFENEDDDIYVEDVADDDDDYTPSQNKVTPISNKSTIPVASPKTFETKTADGVVSLLNKLFKRG